MTGAALVAYARAWHRAHEHHLLRPPALTSAPAQAAQPMDCDAEAMVEYSEPGAVKFQFAFHSFMGDCTNSRCWKGSKCGSMEVWSAYLLNPTALSDLSPVTAACDYETWMADIQRVQDVQ